MPRFNEKSVVEDYIIEELEKNNWDYVPPEELERDSFEEPLLINNLIRKIQEINKETKLGNEEIKKVIDTLKLSATGVEGVKKILNYLKKGVPIKFEKEKVVHYVKLFDYENLQNNEFIVTRQVVFKRGNDEIRTDIMLYVNGIPLADIECKNPADFSISWYDAYRQIKDYEQKIPELFKYVQIGAGAEQAARYFAIVPWQEETKTHEWKVERKDPIDSLIELFTPQTFLDIIKNFLFLRIETGEQTKVLPRYMQYRAVNKVVQRVLNKFDGKGEKDKGLVWHWQGSGKTLEMIFAANKLYHHDTLENPSIFFVVDRTELDEQLIDEFSALDIITPEPVTSIHDLKKILVADGGKGKRGIFITLIHKFRTEELHQLTQELEKLSKDNETILTRKNVIAFIDEGHRTQYGTLAAQMRNILRNAFFFAFTGTPISKRGKDTYLSFSYPPEEKYLDKYFITDSIKDGFTVKIAYQPRLEKDVHLKRDLLEAFLEIEDEELPEEVKQNVKDKVKQKLNLIKVYLENPERIKKVAEDIAKHFKENLDGKFKAMVIGVNRASCVHYKKELDKLLPKEYSEIIMTFDEKKDPQLIKDYLKQLKEQHKGKEIEDIRKDTVTKFKEEENPKILIVTDMLLTGFDAPILQSLYLDKPLKEHRLLQAIARTNRPYKDVKEAGLILDYVGILNEFKKAFETYSKEEIKGALYNFDDLRLEFKSYINDLLDMFKDVPKDKTDRKTLLKAIEILTSDEERSKTFLTTYKTMRRIFELLGPDTIKAQLFTEYQWITSIYTYYLRMVLRSQPTDNRYVKQYFEKTIKLAHKATEFKDVESELPIIEFDERYLNNLDEKFHDKEEKAANMVFTLNRFVLVEKHKNPVYESLVEKVSRLLDMWKEKTKDFERVYKEGVSIIKEIDSLSMRQKKLGFSENQYSLLLVLEKKFGKHEQLIEDIKKLTELLQQDLFKGWLLQPTARKNVERTIRQFIRKYVKECSINLQELDELYKQLINRVRSYAT